VKHVNFKSGVKVVQMKMMNWHLQNKVNMTTALNGI